MSKISKSREMDKYPNNTFQYWYERLYIFSVKNKKYYTLVPVIFPLIVLVFHLILIYSVDRKLEYAEIPVQYEPQDPIVGYRADRVGFWKDFIGARKSLEAKISFYDIQGHFYERTYSPAMSVYKRVDRRFRELILQVPDSVSAYIDPATVVGKTEKRFPWNSYSKTGYFYLGEGKEKTFSYYLEISNYVKSKYFVLYLMLVVPALFCFADYFVKFGKTETNLFIVVGFLANLCLGLLFALFL